MKLVFVALANQVRTIKESTTENWRARSGIGESNEEEEDEEDEGAETGAGVGLEIGLEGDDVDDGSDCGANSVRKAFDHFPADWNE